jgi:hypothetical protein
MVKKHLIFFLTIITFFLVTSCAKEAFQETDYCAVVMLNEATFVEYWFTNKEEFYIFVSQMPKFQRFTSYNPVEDYLLLKKLKKSNIRRARLDKAPPFAELPEGQVITIYDYAQ